MGGHTQGRLRLNAGNETELMSDNGLLNVARAHCGGMSGIKLPEAEANAARIMASWNATAGISVEALEAGVIGELVAMLEHYQDQLCEGIGEIVGDFCGKVPDDQCVGCKAFNLLAKIKGEA